MVETVEQKVQKALDEIKPQIQADGGDIDLVAVEGTTTSKLKLRVCCSGCPMAAMTLNQGVERIIKARVPEITQVESVHKTNNSYIVTFSHKAPLFLVFF
jgi:Fe-S cluster biogenesis protein NfuA